jgi:hypothetical protein
VDGVTRILPTKTTLRILAKEGRKEGRKKKERKEERKEYRLGHTTAPRIETPASGDK